MNERIRKLALQMGWEEMGADLYGKSMDGCMNIYALEKFAELIIAECCDIADEVERADMDSFVSKYIKAHFGVEESKVWTGS